MTDKPEKIVTTTTMTMEEYLRFMRQEEEDATFINNHKYIFYQGGQYPFGVPVKLDNGTVVWLPSSINPAAKIGASCVIGMFTNITGEVTIGDWTRIQGHVFIPAGVTIGKRVFVGPGVIFTNTTYPTVRFGPNSWERTYEKTTVKDCANIGAGAIICPGVVLGERCMIAAGSVVTGNVMDGWLVKGNPARHVRVFADLEHERAMPEPGNTDSGWERKEA
jgi:acetyltransferase-like isoleucine patch superfamily enzyme